MTTFKHFINVSRLPISYIPLRRAAGSTTSRITGGSMPPSALIGFREGKYSPLDQSNPDYKAAVNALMAAKAEQTFKYATGLAYRRKLFTPGPLMVSDRVKKAMKVDIGKRHADFSYVVKFVRASLLKIAQVNEDNHTAILLNGSGTFATESTVRTVLGNSKKKLIVMENGRYAKRIADLSRKSGIFVKVIPVDLRILHDVLISTPRDIGGVITVHCESSSGKINPVNEIGDVVKKCIPECLYFVDAMTSFGAIPIKMQNVDFLMSNSCKCLQGVPGVSFTIAKKRSLQKHRGGNVGLVLDIGAQYDQLERNQQFRFTPPTHVMLGLKECILEYVDEGGMRGRAARYRKNAQVLREEMGKMGFRQLYSDQDNPDGYIVTSFHYPKIPQFVFEEFYRRLSDAGHVISPEKGTVEGCFRIGTIGEVYEDDVRALTDSIRHVCKDMRIDLPLMETY